MSGWVHVPTNAELLQREVMYGCDIRDWLRRNFPEWNRESSNGTHPAAITTVIRLHHRYGKGRLTKSQHGGEIRAAVKRWEKQWDRPDKEDE